MQHIYKCQMTVVAWYVCYEAETVRWHLYVFRILTKDVKQLCPLHLIWYFQPPPCRVQRHHWNLTAFLSDCNTAVRHQTARLRHSYSKSYLRGLLICWIQDCWIQGLFNPRLLNPRTFVIRRLGEKSRETTGDIRGGTNLLYCRKYSGEVTGVEITWTLSY